MTTDGEKIEAEELVEETEENNDGGGTGVSKTVLIIIIAGFALFMVVAGAGFYILWQKVPGSPAAGVLAAKSATQGAPSGNAMGPIYPINPFVINLAGSGGKRFLRIKMDLELKDQKTFEQVRAQFPRVKDKLLTILSSKTFEDISTVKGKELLRAEIAGTIDTLLYKGAVTNVYLTDFVIE